MGRVGEKSYRQEICCFLTEIINAIGVPPQEFLCQLRKLKSLAGEVEVEPRKIAAGAVERAPEIRGLVVGVVQDDG